MADGQVPYADFDLEYPPLAAALFWLGRSSYLSYTAPSIGKAIETLIEQAEVVEESTWQPTPTDNQPELSPDLTTGPPVRQLPAGEPASD